MPGAETVGALTVGQFIGLQAGIGFGMTALSYGLSYFTQRNKGVFGNENERNFQVNGSSTETYLPVLYGKSEIGINRIFIDTDPDNRDWLYFAGVFAHGIIDRVTKIRADGETIATYNVSSKKWEVDEDYRGLVGTIETRRGSDHARHYTFIGDKFPEWTDDRRARGCASVAVSLKYDQDKFSGGIPRVTVVVRGQRVYDPRSPGSANAYTNNLALVALDYLRAKRYGMDARDEEIDFDSFIAEANHCDETIEGDPLDVPAKCKPKIRKMLCKLDYGATYNYKITYASSWSANNLGAIDQTAASSAGSVVIANKRGRVTVTVADPTDANKAYIDKINVWRTEGDGADYYLAKQLDYESESDDNELSFIDNMSDEDLILQTPMPGSFAWDTSPAVSAPPSAPTASFTAYTGSLTVGKYYRYKIIYGNANGHTQGGGRSKAIQAVKGKKVGRLFDIDISDDKSITWRAIYRTPGMTNPDDDIDDPATYPYKYLYTVNDNDTEEYIDITADARLGSEGGADGQPKGAALTPDTLPTTATITSGQQARYTFDGIVDCSKVVINNMEDILFCGLARLYLESGKWRIHIKKPTVAETFTLNEDNIIGDWDFDLPGTDVLCSTVRAAFINPKANEQTDYITFPPKKNLNQYLIDHNRLEIPREIELRGVRNKRKAQRLAMIYRNLANQSIPVSVKVMESALKARIGSVVSVTHSTPGWSGKKFWHEGCSIGQDGTNFITLTEYTADAFDLQYLNADPPDDTDSNLPEANAPPDEVSGVTFTDETYVSNGRTFTRIKANFTNPTSPFWDFSEVYIQKNEGEWEYYTQIDRLDNSVFYVDNVQEEATYYFIFLSVSTLNVREEFNPSTFDKTDAENHITVWPDANGHTVANISPPPDIESDSINVAINGSQIRASWQYNLDPASDSYVTDFDHFLVGFSQTADWSGVVPALKFRTKSTGFSTHLAAGGWYILLKAVDTAGNESNGAGSEAYAAFSILDEYSGSWATIINGNFSTGTHDGTERADIGGGDYRLRVKQNNLTNPSFTTDLSNWTSVVGTWLRTTSQYYSAPAGVEGNASGSNMYIEARNSDNVNMVIETQKSYIFTAQCKTTSAKARISAVLDTTVGEANSNYHPGDNNWHELAVITQTQSTLETTPKVRLKRDAETPGKICYFDNCKFTRYRAEYYSAIYDNTTDPGKKIFKLDYVPISGVGVKGKIYIDLGYSSSATFASDVTWVTGLESQEITVDAKRYIRYRIRFEGVWPDEELNIDEDVGSGVACILKWADPSTPAGAQTITNNYIPYGQGTTTLGESQYFAWEYI